MYEGVWLEEAEERKFVSRVVMEIGKVHVVSNYQCNVQVMRGDVMKVNEWATDEDDHTVIN